MERHYGTVVGGFSSRETAERAADELRAAGFTDDDLIIAAREQQPVPGGVASRGGAAVDPTEHLVEILGLTGATADQTRAVAHQFGSSQAVVAVRGGQRAQDAVRIFHDFGAEIGGIAAAAFTGYDSPVTTRETVAPRGRVEVASTGQLTGRQRTWEDLHPVYRAEFERRANATALRWEDVEPGYRYGFELSTDERYRQQDWAELEPQFQTGYTTWAQQRGYSHDEGIWDRIRQAVKEAWERAVNGEETTGTRMADAPTAPPMTYRWVRLHAEPRDLGSTPGASVDDMQGDPRH